jgi:hypothetical protein
MKNKKISPLLAVTVLSVALGVNAPAQTNGPAAPKGLRVQALPELAEGQLTPSQLPPSPLEPSQPMPSRPMPTQPQPARPVMPGPVMPTPTPPGPIDPGQAIKPVQPPPPMLPLQPDGPRPNRPPLFTNHPSVFQYHAPEPTNRGSALTNHPPELLPGDI